MMLLIIRRYGELDDDIDKLQGGERNAGKKGWTKVMRFGFRPGLLSTPPV